MEYIVYYSTPDQASRANSVLQQECVKSRNEGSNLFVRLLCSKMEMNDIIPALDYQVKGRIPRVDPILKIQYDSSFFSRLWPSGLFSDVTLRVSNKQDFRVHRAILASVSDYFYALFTKMRETDQRIIFINQVDPDLFNELLYLIYGGSLIFKGLKGLQLLILIKYFQIKGIDIDSYLQDSLGPAIEDFPEYLTLLNELYPTGLNKIAMDHIEELLEFYYDSNQESQEFFMEIWELLPDDIRRRRNYLIRTD